jgi:hypothetical protein
VTLSRYQFVLLVMVAVIAAAVGIAVYYVERVYKEREAYVDKIKQGDVEDLVDKPRPPAPRPPTDRPTDRTEVLAVLGRTKGAESAPSSRPSSKLLQVLGNGEFVRLPALPDEPGPVVTGILDRATVDRLLGAAAPAGDRPDAEFVATTSAGTTAGRRPLTAAETRPLLEIAGRQMNRAAAPQRAFLRTAAADPGPSRPWPLERAAPETFAKGAELVPGADRARFREAVLILLEKDARFSDGDRVWKVVTLELIP